jgi:JmjC domain, hydroxylase
MGLCCCCSGDSEYAGDGWNLNNAARLEGSLLRFVDEHLPGITVPCLNVAMMFSCFCWHVEDHMFYSIDYNHCGDAKQW